MATTPTFGWPTPDDTDLVRDGAAAIRALGDAVDLTTLENWKIRQVVAVAPANIGIATTSFTTIGTASITPTSDDSKVLVLFTSRVFLRRLSTTFQSADLRFLRGSTSIKEPVAATKDLVNIDLSFGFAYTFLDSPNQSSSVTYTVQGKAFTTANSGEIAFAENGLILMEVGDD